MADMNPTVALILHDPLTLDPSPAQRTGLACTGAGREQGEGKVPLAWTGDHVTEVPGSFSS